MLRTNKDSRALAQRLGIISYRQAQDVPQLRCLGVPCDTASDSTGRPTLDAERFRKLLFATEDLVTVYWALRVLYVVVEPEQLRACPSPRWSDTKSSDHDPDLEQRPDDDDDDRESASEGSSKSSSPPTKGYRSRRVSLAAVLRGSTLCSRRHKWPSSGGWPKWSRCSRWCAISTTGQIPATTAMRKNSQGSPTTSRSPCTSVSSRGESEDGSEPPTGAR